MGEQYSGACCLVKRVGLLLCAITDREESHYNQLNESLIWTLSSRLCNTNHANFGNSNPEHCGDGNLHDITIRDRISMEYTMCCCPRNWVNGLTYSCSKTLDVKQIFLCVQFKEQRDVKSHTHVWARQTEQWSHSLETAWQQLGLHQVW